MPWVAATTKSGLRLIRRGQAENTAARTGAGTQTEGHTKEEVLQLRLMGENDRKDGSGEMEKRYSHAPPSRSWRNLSRMMRAISAGDRSTFKIEQEKKRELALIKTRQWRQQGVKAISK